MKFRKLLCLILACLMLAGCGNGAAKGDVEHALDALIREDYQTALVEADAFLKQVPQDTEIHTVRQTAAWGILMQVQPEIILSDGTWSQVEYGFQVTDLPEQRKSDIHIHGYWVGMDYEQQTVCNRDIVVFYLRSLTLYWSDSAGQEHVYEIPEPETLQRRNMAESLLAQSHDGDQIDDQTRQALADQAQKALVPSLKEVFKQIEKQTDLTAEHLGFTAWNEN